MSEDRPKREEKRWKIPLDDRPGPEPRVDENLPTINRFDFCTEHNLSYPAGGRCPRCA
jgi:hypothetical protein